MTEVKFVTREELQAMREEMVAQLIDVIDGKPAAVNITALLEVLMLVAVDFGMDQNKLIDLVSGTAMQYYHAERTEGILQ